MKILKFNLLLFAICAKLLIFFVFVMHSQAQQIGSFHTLRLAPLGVSYSYEWALTSKMSIISEAGIMPGIISGLKNIYLQPHINLEPRIYYNLAKRAGEKKSVLFNSANYISLSGVLIYDPKSQMPNYGINPKWGLRRSLPRNFFWGFDLGILFLYETKTENCIIYPLPNIRIGYAFHK